MKTDRILTLFDSYADDLYRFAVSYTGSKQEAEDIVQDVFLKLLSKNIAINSSSEKSYLFKMTANLCKDYLKRTKETLLEENEFEEENQTEQILNRVLIEQVLEQLPDESREVLTLYYFQELKLTEISDTLQIGLPLVKYRLQKARKQLRELLGKEEFNESERKDKKI